MRKLVSIIVLINMLIYVGCVSDNTANDIYGEQTSYNAGVNSNVISTTSEIDSIEANQEALSETDRIAKEEADKASEIKSAEEARLAEAKAIFEALSSDPASFGETEKVSEFTYHIHIDSLNLVDLDLDFIELLVDYETLRPVLEYVFSNRYNYERSYISQILEPSSIYMMANKMNQLPSDYVPEGLLIPKVRSVTSADVDKRYQRPEMAEALEAMFNDAEAEGLILYASSGYRSFDTQVSTYGYHVASKGQVEADKVSARAGHSEHQSGITMDVTCEGAGYKLLETFGDMPEGIFVKENAHLYGLIIRYPEDKTHITGYSYEPWHLRYVGIPLATYLYEHNITLEEFYFFIQENIELYSEQFLG